MRKPESTSREKLSRKQLKQAKKAKRAEEELKRKPQPGGEHEAQSGQAEMQQQIVSNWIRMPSNEERYTTVLSVGFSALVGGAGECAQAAAMLATEIRAGIQQGLLLTPEQLDELAELKQIEQVRLQMLRQLESMEKFMDWCDQWSIPHDSNEELAIAIREYELAINADTDEQPKAEDS